MRFVGKLYRHYAIEGKTDMLTNDPLFLTHLQNADFEKGIEGWTLQAAEAGRDRSQELSLATAGSRAATWAWAAPPIPNTSATRSCG